MSARVRDMEHSRLVQAPADRLYALVADVSRWPVLLEPCVLARRVELLGDYERIEVWAQTNDVVTSWVSRRTLDPVHRRVTFAQERTAAPVAAMSGEWSFHPEGEQRTRIRLTHRFAAVDDDAGALDWIAAAVERNSERELAALGSFAELGYPVDRLVFSFSDRVALPAHALAEAYHFVYRADLWPERLPHVSRVTTVEEPVGVQRMEMDTVTSDGRVHTTRSVRLCFPDTRVVYKQTVLPALLSGHSGTWDFEAGPEDAAIVSRHTVAIDPTAVERVLGAGTTLAAAREYVRETLGANSRATMEAARRYSVSVVRP